MLISMRAVAIVLALVGLPGIASADLARECHFHKPTIKVQDLGCFDDLKNTGDHTYGTRLCLVRAANKCSGVMWFWDGDLEGQAAILDDVTCSKTGAVTFYGSQDAGASIYLINFTGKIAKRVLRGSWAKGKEKRKVAWKQTKDGFDAADKIRTLTKAACTPAAP